MFYLNKYQSLSVSQKAAIWYIACNILQKGIAFLVVPIYVRLLTTSEYGRYTIFQSWCGIIAIFATLNLHCGVYTKAMVDYADDRDRYTSSMQVLSSLITILLFLVYLLASSWWESRLEMDNVTILLMFLYFLTFPSFSFWSVRQRVENKYKMMVLLTLSLSVVTPAISLYLLFYTDLRVNAVIWGYLLSQICFGAFFYVFQMIKGRCFYHRQYWIHALHFNIPLLPHYLSLVVLSQIDRILIGNFCGKDKAGIYGLGAQIAMVISIFFSGINSSFVPWIYEKFKSKDFESVKLQTKRLCIVAGVIVLSYMLIVPEIVQIMGTSEYREAIWVVPAISLSVYVTFCYGLYACVEFYYNETTYVMIATTSGACLSIALNLVLLPIFGYISAGYTSLLCYTFFMLMHYLFQQKISNKTLDGISVFDNRFIWSSCFVLFVLMLLCLLTYTASLIRYTLIIISLGLMFVYKDKIVSTLKVSK